MIIKTKHFGEVELDEDKILTFENGIFGFENDKRYALIYSEENDNQTISWLQSLDTVSLALPVINPEFVKEDYNPIIDDEVLISLGELHEANTAILLTLTVPSDLTKMTSNLKAPIIINSETKKACQVVAENPEYVVKFNVYEVFQAKKKTKGV